MRWLSRKIRALGHPVMLGVLLLVLGAASLAAPVWLEAVDASRLDLDYGDIVSICAFVSTIVIAIFSVVPNLRSMADTSRSAHYSELDNMYLHLLTLAVDKPYLRRPETLTEAQRHAYEPYVFMVWNFLETIHDRCTEDARLRDTWAPVIAAEHKIHRAWFEQETVPYDDIAAPKFCLAFCDFVWRNFWLADAAAPVWQYRSESAIRHDPRVARWIGGDAGRAAA